MTDVPLEVSNFFLSMQAGKSAADALAACFDDDATYEEPFTGTMRKHVGKHAIIGAMAAGWDAPLAEQRICIDRAAVRENEVLVDWTCYSPSLPGGKGSGLNRFRIENGLITSLRTTLKDGAKDE